MIQLQQLIKPTWGIDKWLDSAWSILNDKEKKQIARRIDQMFDKPLPFELVHDKTTYLHLFSLLTQLEVFGLQGLLKTLEKLSGGEYELRFRQQILDEIFHALVFAKITYELTAPYSLPPMHSRGVEKFLSLLSNETDLKTSFVLINLVAEGWIEEIFAAMKKYKVAPRVFDVVLEDESRHLEESALYLAIGTPETDYLSEKLAAFEEELISMNFTQHTYVLTLVNLLGTVGARELLSNIDKKHHQLLKQINFKPSPNWQFFMSTLPAIIQDVFHDETEGTLVPQTTTRQILTSLWSEPDLPTESSMFSIDVTPVGFFEKKFRPETITCLTLQALSKALADHPVLKNYMSNLKIFNPNYSYVGLGVLLPGCDDHLGMIEFRNCHEMHISELARYIQQDMQIMVYCYKRSQQLKLEHPYLMDLFNTIFAPRNQSVYRDPMFARPTISVSNIGHWGYETVISPLFPNETVKLTLAKIDKKQIWNKTTNLFEVRDIMPVGISVDHRVFDANLPVPSIMQKAFDDMFEAMQHPPKASPEPNSSNTPPLNVVDEFIQLSERLLQDDLELGFRYLFFSSQVWKHHTELTTFMESAKSSLADKSKKSSQAVV